MGILRRLFAASDEPDPTLAIDLDADVDASGWDAIDQAVGPRYPGQEPQHWGTLVGWRLGGPDPLDGVSAYRADGPPEHWHYVTYGLSELYAKESDDAEHSGWGFELTFRLRRDAAESEAPMWPVTVFQDLARYVFESGNVFMPGQNLEAKGIETGTATAIQALAFVLDPQLGSIDTPNGQVEFVQAVGLTIDELAAVKGRDAREFLARLAETNPLLVTDLARTSTLVDPST